MENDVGGQLLCPEDMGWDGMAAGFQALVCG